MVRNHPSTATLRASPTLFAAQLIQELKLQYTQTKTFYKLSKETYLFALSLSNVQSPTSPCCYDS